MNPFTALKYVSNGADLETDGPNIHDHDRAGTSRFDVNTARMGELIFLNRRVAIRNLSTALGLLIGSLQNEVPEELGHRKVCACWVPKRLTEG
jgi:hypothetical protein